MTPPNLERQIHRACGDVRVALSEALQLLTDAAAPSTGDDVFRAFSDLGCAQHHVAVALHATNLLDQMVGTPAEQRRPWSYYRGRLGRKLPRNRQPSVDDCLPLRGDDVCLDHTGDPDSTVMQRLSARQEPGQPARSMLARAVLTRSQRQAARHHQKRPPETPAAKAG